VITDVPGLRVGHVTDAAGLTGVTVVITERPAVCAAELRGGANDVVGLDFLHPRHLVPYVHALVLGGGSRFGEESVAGVMRWLEERGVGFPVSVTVVPHVPGAFLFDLGVGDRYARPTREMGYEAAARAVAGPVAEGSVGAGTGATVGKIHGLARAMRGGIGSASARAGTVVVGALVAVNSLGDVRDPVSGRLIAGARDAPGGRTLVDARAALRSGSDLGRFGAARAAPSPALQNTTIGVVATTARLTKPQAATLASLAMGGFERALSPPHTAFDGDTLFALSAGDDPADLTWLGIVAADVVAEAIARAVAAATSLPGLPAARDLGTITPTDGR
jgi:L-aminopeptidase/D-esterase-like protein